MNKRGVSDVVSVVLLLLVTILAVGLMWAIISASLRDAGENVDSGFDDFLRGITGIEPVENVSDVGFGQCGDGFVNASVGEECEPSSFDLTCADFRLNSGSVSCVNCQIVNSCSNQSITPKIVNLEEYLLENCLQSLDYIPGVISTDPPINFAPYYPGAPGYIHPSFVVNYAGGMQRYSVQTVPVLQRGGNVRIYNDSGNYFAVVSYLGNDIWEFNLTNTNPTLNITSFTFPYDHYKFRLDADDSNDILYVPRWSGVAYKESGLIEHSNDFATYPGWAFAPLSIVADNDQARIVAAVNWDGGKLKPKTTEVIFDKHRQKLNYREVLKPGQTAKARALISIVSGDESQGIYPWHNAMEKYRTWMNQVVAAEGLEIEDPDWGWMKQSEGFHNVQLEGHVDLQNVVDFSHFLLDNYGNRIDFILAWGQMADYFGPCCGMNRTMHSRYFDGTPTLPERAQEIVDDGKHIGYYVRPLESNSFANYLLTDLNSYSDHDAQNETPLEYLRAWVEKNEEEYNANVHYIDVLGAGQFAHPVCMAKLFRDEILPQSAVIEYGGYDFVDMPALISGSLASPMGSELDTLEDDSFTAFPALKRYLLNDRIFFEGVSNDDHKYANHTYNGFLNENLMWRISFLLGAKLDTQSFWEYPSTTLKPMIDQILSERDRVDYWSYEPVYLDKRGIYDIVGARDVSRFSTNVNKHFIAIDNYDRSESVSMKIDGVQYNFDIPDYSRDGLPMQFYYVEISV